MRKRIISLCMCLAMVLTMLPVMPWAAEATYDVFDRDGVQVASNTSLTFVKADSVNAVIDYFTFTENVGDYTDTITAVQSDAANCDWIVKIAGKKPVYMYLKTTTISYGTTLGAALDVYDSDGVQVAGSISLTYFKADSVNGVIAHYRFTENVGDYTDTITAVQSDAANGDWVVKEADKNRVVMYLKEIASVTYNPDYTNVARYANLGTKCGQYNYTSDNFTANDVFYTAVDGNGDVILFVKDDTGNCRLAMGIGVIACSRIGKLSECVVQHTWEVHTNDMSAVCTACGAAGKAYENLGDVPSGATYDYVDPFYIVYTGGAVATCTDLPTNQPLPVTRVLNAGVSCGKGDWIPDGECYVYQDEDGNETYFMADLDGDYTLLFGGEQIRARFEPNRLAKHTWQIEEGGRRAVCTRCSDEGYVCDDTSQIPVGMTYDRVGDKYVWLYQHSREVLEARAYTCRFDREDNRVTRAYCEELGKAVAFRDTEEDAERVFGYERFHSSTNCSISMARFVYDETGGVYLYRSLQPYGSLGILISISTGVSTGGFGGGASTETIECPYTAESGRCGDNTYWSLDTKGTMTISGSGTMDDYVDDVYPWQDQLVLVKKLAIGSSVTYVPDAVFVGDDNVNHKSKYNSLDAYAVEEGNPTYCSVNGVLFTADGKTLLHCPDLQSSEYAIPEGVQTIGDGAFIGGHRVRKIIVPEGVQTIGQGILGNNNDQMLVIFLGDAPAKFDSYSLGYMKGTVYYPAENDTWAPDVLSRFRDTITCRSYQSGEMRYFDKGTFGRDFSWQLDENGVLTVTGTGEMDWGGSHNAPWSDWSDAIRSVVIGRGITGVNGFFGCDNLTSVTLPDTLTAIDSYAFSSCKNLKSLSLPEGLTTIGDCALIGCGLTSVTIPSTVTAMGTAAIDSEEFLVAPGNRFFSAVDGMLLTADKRTLVRAPVRAEVAVPSCVKVIGDYAFSGLTKLTSVTIPTGVKTIGRYSFCDTALKDVTIPATVTAIGDFAFAYCERMSAVSIPEGVKTIGECAFIQTAMTEVTIPATVTAIGDFAFAYCGSLNRVYFLGDAPEIYECTFRDVTATVYYPSDGAAWADAKDRRYDAALTWQSYTPGQPIVVASGTDLGFTWTLDRKGVLDITGEGAVPAGASWLTHNNDIAVIKLGSGVTDVTDNAFAGCSQAKDVFFAAAAADWFHCIAAGLSEDTVLHFPRSATANVVTAVSADKPITATLTDGDGKPVDADVNGKTLSLDNVDDGTYHLKVEQDGCVARTVTVVIDGTNSAGPVVVPNITLVKVGNLNGAVDSAGKETDVDDMQCLFTYLSTEEMNGTLVEDPVYFCAVADVNGDTSVNILDYQAMYELVRT